MDFTLKNQCFILFFKFLLSDCVKVRKVGGKKDKGLVVLIMKHLEMIIMHLLMK